MYAGEELWRRIKKYASEIKNAADICLSVSKMAADSRQHSRSWLRVSSRSMTKVFYSLLDMYVF
jgi:hypothetical protein